MQDDFMSKENTQGFWKPAQQTSAGAATNVKSGYCTHCGAQFTLGARFCHVCGTVRRGAMPHPLLSHWLDTVNVSALRTVFGGSVVSLICVTIAALCLIGAAFTGIIYKSTTLSEWQAVQTWRIEWLLATAVALLAAQVFKNSGAEKKG